MKIALGICTYRRPVELEKLLLSLTRLTDIEALHIIVADNDEAGEGIAVCNKLADNYPFQIVALSETSSGISAIRNTVAMKALSFEPDFIAFLDDDEWPEPQWLSELLRIQSTHTADLVGGPTRPEFPPDTDNTLLNNPYYGADMKLSDGSECTLQAGGNFLIKASVLQKYAPHFFHEAFSHSGSEDLAFFTQLGNDGHSMHWAANAIVHEPVPESRLAPDWLKQRVVNIHNSRVRVMQHLHPGPVASMVRLIKTCALATVTLAMSLIATVMPRFRESAQLLRWKLTGKLTAHFGRKTTRGETY